MGLFTYDQKHKLQTKIMVLIRLSISIGPHSQSFPNVLERYFVPATEDTDISAGTCVCTVM